MLLSGKVPPELSIPSNFVKLGPMICFAFRKFSTLKTSKDLIITNTVGGIGLRRLLPQLPGDPQLYTVSVP